MIGLAIASAALGWFRQCLQGGSLLPGRAQLTDAFGLLCGLDARSLALGRVMMAVFLLLDLRERADDLTALYTDAGMVPRHMVMKPSFPRYSGDDFSVYHGAGTITLTKMVMLATGAVPALMLLVGWQTQLVR